MKKTRLFKCGCGIKVVGLVTDGTQTVKCLCGKLAKRQLSAPKTKQ